MQNQYYNYDNSQTIQYKNQNINNYNQIQHFDSNYWRDLSQQQSQQYVFNQNYPSSVNIYIQDSQIKTFNTCQYQKNYSHQYYGDQYNSSQQVPQNYNNLNQFEQIQQKQNEIRKNQFYFIDLKKYKKKLRENLDLSDQQIQSLQYQFTNYQDFNIWYQNELNYKTLNIDKNSKQSTQINIQQKGQSKYVQELDKLQEDQAQNGKLIQQQKQQVINLNQSDFNFLEQLTNLMSEKNMQIKELEKQNQLLQIKCDKLEQQLFEANQIIANLEIQIQQLYQEVIQVNEKEIDFELKNKIQQSMNQQDENKQDFINFQNRYLGKILEEIRIDNKYNSKTQTSEVLDQTLTFYEWGMRQTIRNSTQYQGDVKDTRLWRQVQHDFPQNEFNNNFDAIMTDAPWDSTAINLNYQEMNDIQCLGSIPVTDLQNNGLLFIWITNKKLETTLRYLESINYERIEIITWVKLNKKLLLKNSIGFYLRHFTEFCIVAKKKGSVCNLKKIVKTHQAPNIIIAPVQEASRKPDQIYEKIETLIPNGKYLEVYGREHNQRERWVTIGNESNRRKKPLCQKAKIKLQKNNLRKLSKNPAINLD